jgi:Phage tail sheath C-terminal domain
MNRRGFFKLVFGVIATAAIAPKVPLTEATQAEAPTVFPTRGTYAPVAVRPYSSLDFINRRRLILSIEKQLEYFMFEPNDAVTRKQISGNLDAYLQFAENNGAIQDYVVCCDESNNSPEIIDRNECRVDVFIRENKSLKMLELNFVMMPHMDMKVTYES